MTKPNVIFILVDDMGYGDFGVLGNDIVETTTLDCLANEGILLTQHYSGSAVCAPARAALMSGRYPHRTGGIDTLEGRGLDRLALREVTMGDLFKSAGYATGLVGKWHLGALDPRFHPNARGFDEFVGFRGGWNDYYEWRLDRNGSFEYGDGRYLTDVFTQEAVGFIERHRTEPFFLHVTYNAPHFPLQVPDEELACFDDHPELDEGVRRIYAMNRRMDKGVGQILDALDKNGLRDNTLVIFTSDNGPEFSRRPDGTTIRYNAGLNGCKGLVYEGGIRVPAILHWPAGLPSSQRIDELVHFTDWLPTLGSIAGYEVPDDRTIDGNPILPLLKGEKIDIDLRRFWQWNRYTPVATSNAAMRDGEWKLIRPVLREANTVYEEDLKMDRALKYEPDSITDICRDPERKRDIPDPPEPLLFNLNDDPGEQTNLAHERPDVLSKMQNNLDNWFDEVEAERRSIED